MFDYGLPLPMLITNQSAGLPMQSTLYYSRNPNPRLCAAVVRYLDAPVTLEWAAPFDPAQSPRFRPLNPSLRIPILVEPGRAPLWETDAITARLCQSLGHDFWRMGADMPDMIRWLSWGHNYFVRACDTVCFEYGTKQRYHLGPIDPAAVAQGLAEFRIHAAQLNNHLAGRDFLLDSGLSYADFRMATFLPFNEGGILPVQDYPHIAAWAARLEHIPAWADPFAGLNTPALPPLPSAQATGGSWGNPGV
jgi:glutathione S-transferase